MHPTYKILALTNCLLLLSAGLLGCRPADPPRMPGTTHSPATVNEATNTEGDQSPVDVEEASPSPAASPEMPETDSTATSNEETQPTTTTTAKPATDEQARPKPQPGKTIDMTFDDIKFDIEPDAKFKRDMLPKGIEDLSGQKIRIGGYMLPSFQQRDIKQFVLVRDNMECCFGAGAALYDCILVEMDGRGIDFTVRPVTVEGTFTVKEYVQDDKHLAIYHLQGTGVR